ncbi:MAG: hypothetical protein GY788_26710 [bacterium]|nr:hypothetical protein [bacterium]
MDGEVAGLRRWARFRVGHVDDRFDEIKAQLALWDHHVAERVIPLYESRSVARGPVDVQAELDNLKATVIGLLDVVRDEEKRDRLEEYLHYCGLLREVQAEVEPFLD